MKKHLKSTTNRVFFGALCLLLVINIMSSISNYSVVLNATKALSIPLFFFLYFIKNKFINNIFITFLILLFFGDLFSMLPTSTLQLKIASASYFCSYGILIAIGLFQVKKFIFKGVVGAYLFIVLMLNSYFMYSFYGIMENSISDNVELFFITMQIVALLILGFVAFVAYLDKDRKQSILFLLLSFCLIFSQVLALIDTHYISHQLFSMLNWISYVASLVLFYNYLLEHNKSTRKLKIASKNKPVEEKIAA